MLKHLSIYLLICSFWVPVFANTVDEFLLKADSAERVHNDMEAIRFYKQALHQDPDNFKALWKTAYLYQRAGWLEEENKERKLELLTNAINYSKKALDKYPNSYHPNLIMAGSIARMAEFQTARDRVHAAWDIQKYAEAAVKLNPNHHEVWYLLGWLNFELSKPTWLERSVAKMLFGGLPHGTYELAVEYLQKAVKLNPGSSVYLYDLATFYESAGQNNKAIALCKKALTFKKTAPEDHLYHEKITRMLARL